MATSGTELLLIRHAPAATSGRLCGRTDVAATPAGLAGMAALRRLLATAPRRLASPALRCRQTAEALWPGRPLELDTRLCEQDFGEWDGLPAEQVPDLGPMRPEVLAEHRPPGGESFGDLCRRVGPAVQEIASDGRDAALVVHAGTVRAALALALASPARALSFEVAPLSVTRLRWLAPHGFSIVCVNCAA